MSLRMLTTILALAALAPIQASAGATTPTGRPAASVDLTTADGLRLVGAEWRYSDTEIVEVDFRAPGPDGQPTGPVQKTYDVVPRAGGVAFDDSAWPVIAPDSLAQRRSTGKLCFNWYRVRLSIPEKIGQFDTRGTTLVFQTSLDDYAEIWVDGELPRAFRQSGGSVIGGWNASNRLVIGRNLKPGQTIQLAVFGINGPISGSPTNFIWMREARLDFYPGATVPLAVEPQEVNVEVDRLDPRLDAIVPANPKIFKLAEGFEFIEGPVWIRTAVDDGHLLFSDPNANRIYRYSEQDGLAVFRDRSGYSGDDIDQYSQPGSNGLTLDRNGRLTINEHGNRRVTRIEPDGSVTVLAAAFKGKRLNSPNDLVYRRDGSLYFSDPPFGLPAFEADPRKELPYSGIFRAHRGKLQLLSTDLKGPNGLAFSPDERFLYVGNWDPERKIVMRYPVRRDGSLGPGEVFFDMTDAPGDESLDGLKLDTHGNLYVSGPGGLWILAADGTHLGTIRAPRLPANFAWGGSDARTLYLTARNTLYRIALNVPGIRP